MVIALGLPEQFWPRFVPEAAPFRRRHTHLLGGPVPTTQLDFDIAIQVPCVVGSCGMVEADSVAPR